VVAVVVRSLACAGEAYLHRPLCAVASLKTGAISLVPYEPQPTCYHPQDKTLSSSGVDSKNPGINERGAWLFARDAAMQELRGKRLEGEWWTPDRPEIIYKGPLQIDEDNDARVTLRGTSLAEVPAQSCFFGRLTAHYSYDVTLFRTLLESGPKPSVAHEIEAVFYANSIVVGGHVSGEDEPLVGGALLNLTGLEEWCDATGFTGNIQLPDRKINVSFQPGASPYYDVGEGRRLRFLSQYRGGPPSGFDRKHVTLRERNTIELSFPEKITINDLMNEVHIWQTFITFGLRRASYFDEIRLVVSDGSERPHCMELVVPGRRTDTSGRRRAGDALFNQTKLGDRIGEYVKAWRENHRNVELAVLLFTGAAYQDAIYVHTNLLIYLQALEVLHRELYKADRFPDADSRKATIAALRAAVPRTLPVALQTLLRNGIGYLGSLTLLERLNGLYVLYPRSLGPLFRRGGDDMVRLKDARNFLTHYDGEYKDFDKDFLWSREIRVLKEKARLFLEICLLGTLGMPDEDIEALVNQFDPYVGLRATASIEMMNARPR
jgi:hypothetical protein